VLRGRHRGVRPAAAVSRLALHLQQPRARGDIAGLARQHDPLGYLTGRYWSPSALWVIDLVVVLTGLGFVTAGVNAIIRILFAMGRAGRR
jgi:hypothetical protein